MSKQLIERIKTHFNSKETKIIEVAEWGEEGAPLYIYATPLTLAQKNYLYKMAKDDDLSLMVEAVIMKAKDKNGENLFSKADKPDLMRQSDPEVITRIANIILGDNDTTQVAEKNLEKSQNYTTYLP